MTARRTPERARVHYSARPRTIAVTPHKIGEVGSVPTRRASSRAAHLNADAIPSDFDAMLARLPLRAQRAAHANAEQASR